MRSSWLLRLLKAISISALAKASWCWPPGSFTSKHPTECLEPLQKRAKKNWVCRPRACAASTSQIGADHSKWVESRAKRICGKCHDEYALICKYSLSLQQLPVLKRVFYQSLKIFVHGLSSEFVNSCTSTNVLFSWMLNLEKWPAQTELFRQHSWYQLFRCCSIAAWEAWAHDRRYPFHF